DAAIVYAGRPFVLVVLVRGLQDAKAGSSLIAAITRVVYEASQAPPIARLKPSLSIDPSSPADSDDRTAQLLSELIRLNTSNPPGKEGQVAELLASKLKLLGFDIEIVPTPEAGKAHLFARLKGDGSRRPLLLAAHADVVGVEREKWSVDPFAGAIKDGHVY